MGLKAGGLNVRSEHALIDAATLEIPRAALDGLAHNPNILSISSDAVTGAHVTVAPSGATLRTALGVTSNATLSTTSGPKGTGVGVAVIDSGIRPRTCSATACGPAFTTSRAAAESGGL
jgi:hypothetical protein